MAPYTPSRLVRSFERHLGAEKRLERTVENYLESLHDLHGRGRRLEDVTKADSELEMWTGTGPAGPLSLPASSKAVTEY
jgi:hypothetical protein